MLISKELVDIAYLRYLSKQACTYVSLAPITDPVYLMVAHPGIEHLPTVPPHTLLVS